MLNFHPLKADKGDTFSFFHKITPVNIFAFFPIYGQMIVLKPIKDVSLCVELGI